MRCITVCGKCGSADIEYLGDDKCNCRECKCETETREKWYESPYERNQRMVYATGNRWAIENWNATHG